MGEAKAGQPPRFVVQCAKGKAWKTLVVEEDQGLGERAFREVVKVNPRGYFRLIRLDYNPASNFEGQEFDWKLLNLHDPKKGRSGGGAGRGQDRRRRGPKEKVPVPFRLYAVAVVLGVILAALLYLLYGPHPGGRGDQPVPPSSASQVQTAPR